MKRGTLRIYLGAAPGVGKTFAMLDEGWRKDERGGAQVVIGYVETHGRVKTEAQVRDLEIIPRRSIEYRGQRFEEMDLDAIVARQPSVVLVDEMAHANVPGSRHEKRWQDIEDLLAAGIDVITTVNIQHLESLNDVVEKITGIKQRETVPDAVVRAADQIELVDMSPEALRRRMAHGNIYAPGKVDAALGNYFRIGNLSALRELALLWVADQVDDSLQIYMAAHGIEGSWETRERVVVAVTGAASGEQLIRRAARMATRTKGELLGVHIRPSDGLSGAPPELLDAHRHLLEDMGGVYHEVVGTDVAQALTQFARAERATQLVLGASRRNRWAEFIGGSIINKVAREAGTFDVHVISYDTADDTPSLRPLRPTTALSRRRRLGGWLIAISGVLLLTVALVPLRDEFGLPGDLMIYLLLVVVAAVVGGVGPGLFAAVAGSLAVNWFFTEPFNTLTIAEAENAAALVAFVLVGAVIALFVNQASRRALTATRATAEAEALARVAAGLVGSDDPLPSMLDRLRSTFGLAGAAVEVRDDRDGPWRTEIVTGDVAPGGAGADNSTLAMGDHARLVLPGPPLAATDRRVLTAFMAQLSSALDQRRLRAEAATAERVSEADALRTAILQAVSHDLRTPLASIKASVTSLLQHDVDWQPDATEEFLHTIDEESDRLNHLVGNLLDMSRLQTGALRVSLQAVGWEEVVAAALASLSEPTDRVVLDVPETLPLIDADPALLERAVANIVANALRHTADDSDVRVEAGQVADRVDLQVIDQGPGIPGDQRDTMFRPFQRLHDRSNDTGVGLGLAVARGFVEAMGGELEAGDTPGGGFTMVIRMRAAS